MPTLYKEDKMKRYNIKKSLLSLLLVLAIILPTTALANSLYVNVESYNKETEIYISSFAGDNISIVIEDSRGDKVFIDQGKTNSSGKLEIETMLDYDSYKIKVKSSNGDDITKSFKIKEDSNTNSNNRDKANIYVEGYKGVILKNTSEEIRNGESILSFTKRVLRKNNISIVEENGYVISIDDQAELDKGSKSGWMVKVNGSFPNKGAGSIEVKNKDDIEWLYTHDLGKDIGNSFDDKEKTKESKLIKNYLKNNKLAVSDLDKIESELEKSTNINDIKNALEILKGMDNNNQDLLIKGMDLNNLIIERLKVIDTRDILRETRINLDIYFYLIENLNNKSSIRNFESIVKKSKEIESKYDKGILSLLDESYNSKLLSKEIFNKLIDNNIDKLNIKLKDIDFETSLDFLNGKTNDDLIFSYDGSTINIKNKSGKVLDNFYTPIKISLKYRELINREFTANLDNKNIGGMYNRDNKRLNFFLNKSGNIKVIDNKKTFGDIDKVKWAEESIETMAAKEIVKGISNIKFNPNGNITRAEFAAITSRMLNLNISKDNIFSDIKSNDWYREDVLKILEKGYINGKSKNTFDPNGNITREEIAKIIGEIAKDYDVKIEKESLNKFNDNGKISPWAKEGAEISNSLGIIKGSDGMFNPKNNGTRAEVVTMLFRLYEILLVK